MKLGLEDHEGLLVTPTSSAISLSSTGSHPAHTHTQFYPNAPSAVSGTPKTPTQVGTSSAYGIGNVTPTPSPSASGAKRIFGKIFNKKRDTQGLESASEGSSRMISSSADVPGIRSSSSQTELRQSTRTGTSLGVFSNAAKRRSANASSPTPSRFDLPPVPGSPSASDRAGGGVREQQQLQPAVLGIQPTLSARFIPPAGRPTRYVWIVRKWLKGDDGGLLGGVMRNVGGMVGGINIGPGGGLGPSPSSGQVQAPLGGEFGVEVRFEWVRGQSKSQEKKASKKAAALAKLGSTSFSQEDAGGSTRQRSRRSLGGERRSEGASQQEKSRSRGRGAGSGRPATSAGTVTGPSANTPATRLSGESRHSAERNSQNSRTNSMTSAFSGERIATEDDGDDSDPEDSETPWICTLVVSSIPSTANRLWEHEYYEKDGGLGLGLGLAKKESRRSHLSQAGYTPEQSGEPSAQPPKPPPKSPSKATQTSPDPSTPTPSQQQQPPHQSASHPPVPPPKPPKSSDAPGTLLKLKVGALSPAPHHPKVVAQMKVPYPLPDVEVARARVRRRVLTPAGVARPVERAGTLANTNYANREERERSRLRGALFGNGNGNGEEESEDEGPILTAEEIKDVLSCTAFWIVVREGFGGVGKVNRKGDGWRIRG